MNKLINAKCICKDSLTKNDINMIAILPCEHLIHFSCVKYIRNKKCPYCNIQISNLITFNEIKKEVVKKNKSYYQLYIDMIAVHNIGNSGEIIYSNLIPRMPSFMKILTNFLYLKNEKEFDSFINDLFDLIKVQIYIKGKEKLNKQKKVYIANHTSYIDPLIIYYLLRCSFLASPVLQSMWYCKHIPDIFPLLLIERGKDQNTVDKIKEFIDNKRSLCLFPEGMITHPKTMITFRSGAFHTGHPVQPIVINYKPGFYDGDYNNFLMKLISQDEIKIYINVLDTYYPPFDNNKIEQIRQDMANAGGYSLSRISNRDIKD